MFCIHISQRMPSHRRIQTCTARPKRAHNGTGATGCSVLLLVSALNGLVFGYELGIISGAFLQLKAEFRLSCVQQEALVSSLLIGALLASITGGCLIDRYGCRSSILHSNILVLTGSLVMLVSSYPALFVGRIVVGFAMCTSSMSCCIFVSEMVSPGRRGFVVTLYEAGITAGILAAYVMNYIFSGSARGWKWMFGLAALPTLVQLVSVGFLPASAEKPNFQGDCFQTERDLAGTVEAQDAGDSRVIYGKDIEEVGCNSLYLFRRRDNMRTRTVIGLGLVLFQQFTGQPNILSYASTIFRSVGFRSDASAVLASVGLGLVKVIATLNSMVFSDRVGRRPLLISGCFVMAACLMTMGFLSGHLPINSERSCHSQDYDINATDLPHSPGGNRSVFDTPLNGSHPLFNNGARDEDAVFDKVARTPAEPAPESSLNSGGSVTKWIILMCMMAVVTAYSVGFGPMTWLLLSEIFPAAVRGRAFAFTNCFNWAANLLVTFTFLDVADMIGLSGMFIVYGLTAVAAGVFFYFLLPETKGKTLEEIDEELRADGFRRGGDCYGFVGGRNTSKYRRVHCQVGASGALL
ncbi:solute carrier family 2, facilitated glucose transporter member 10 isoform X1 [Brachyistius frenatus]|uniref:solute carrier family 2, facilitated glucose transporter member 10 isoform X1 n=2 Tax=Brachyistius frenatus TaxID=100188 RepID=UPI0037E7B9D1